MKLCKNKERCLSWSGSRYYLANRWQSQIIPTQSALILIKCPLSWLWTESNQFLFLHWLHQMMSLRITKYLLTKLWIIAMRNVMINRLFSRYLIGKNWTYFRAEQITLSWKSKHKPDHSKFKSKKLLGVSPMLSLFSWILLFLLPALSQFDMSILSEQLIKNSEH